MYYQQKLDTFTLWYKQSLKYIFIFICFARRNGENLFFIFRNFTAKRIVL